MRIFTKESLELLRQRIDLVEVVSSSVDLKRAGASFKALCPFHEEKTPSFVIQRGDTHYHCFGCGAHGDAIEFLMSHQKMSFLDAVEHLAEKFGVELQEQNETATTGPSKVLLKDALEKALHFYHFCLLHTEEGHGALSYLYSRGIDLDFIKTFEIGYAPKDFLFQRTMQKQNIQFKLLEDAGLIKMQPSPRDFFTDRIMIPIRDGTHSVIGFSARKFKEETFGPKYINTPETLLFKKSKVLFGLSYSRKKIARERRAVVVEGQFDALRLIYEGISIAVAGQGTAFGESHVQELISLGVNKVYLALDGDKAGQEAAIKIGHLFQKEAVEVFVIKLPQKKDPDSFVKEKGPDEFIKLMKESSDYLSYLVEVTSQSLDMNSPAAKNELIQTLIARIKEWDHPLMVHESLRKIAKLTNTPESMVGIEKTAPNVYVKKTSSISAEKIDPDRILETDVLRFLLLVSDSGARFASIAKINIFPELFKVSVCRRLYSKCLEAYLENKNLDLLSLAIDLDDAEEQLFLSELFQKKINRERAEEGFIETLQKLLDRHWMEKREEIKIKIQSGRENDETLLELAKEFDEIKNKRPEVIFPS